MRPRVGNAFANLLVASCCVLLAIILIASCSGATT